MLEFAPNTNMLEYQDGAYLCNGTKRVEAPLNLETLEEAVRQCPKLQAVSLYDAPFGDQCFPLLAQIPRLNMLALLRGGQITGHGLELLKDLPLKDLFLQRTALDDEGLAQAAQIGKLENLYIAACRHVTPRGCWPLPGGTNCGSAIPTIRMKRGWQGCSQRRSPRLMRMPAPIKP